MDSLDLLIIVVVLALAALGYAQGFIVGAASLMGLVLGGVVGTRVSHALLERAAEGSAASDWAPLVGLGIGMLITLSGAMAMQDLGAELRGRVDTGQSVILDHVGGALLLGLVGLLLAWFAAAAAVGAPQLRELRPQVFGSRIVERLNLAMPAPEPILGAIASYDPFPKFDGGRIDTPAPDAKLPADPEVRRAARSVVRIAGTACGYRVTGSGWVASPGYVVTNAHVVAGQQDTEVQLSGGGETRDADVVAFDDVNDLAILRVENLPRPPLVPVRRTAADSAGVVLGYPENRGFTATPARYSDERRVRGDDVYGKGPVERRVTSFRGLVRHGNSGGPMVNGAGGVITTVFASTIGERVAGGYGVPNEIALDRLEEAQRVRSGFAVRTGPCIA